MHFMWDKVSRHALGKPWPEICQDASTLPDGSIFRYGQAGDLPGVSDEIDSKELLQLVKATKHLKVLAYSHKPVTGKTPTARRNRKAIKQAAAEGFVVNLSANNMAHADELLALELTPVTMILPHAYHRDEKKETVSQYRDRIEGLPTHTPAGARIAVCPATYTDTTCMKCQACGKPDRDVVIGFPAHGWWRRAEGSTACTSSL